MTIFDRLIELLGEHAVWIVAGIAVCAVVVLAGAR
jgi:hypothetical protein